MPTLRWARLRAPRKHKGSNGEQRRPVPPWLLRNCLAPLLWGSLVFLAAGHKDWPLGWGFTGLLILSALAMAAFLVPNHTDLLPKAAPASPPSRWREILGAAGAYSPLVLPLVAALDARCGWTALGGHGIAYGGLACAVLGLGLMLWTLASDCFAAILRVVGAAPRARRRAAGGAYAFIRHPGYVGLLLLDLGLPLMLGSWVALAAAVPFIVATIFHTYWDDLILRRELPGYAAYARATPYRILPYIW